MTRPSDNSVGRIGEESVRAVKRWSAEAEARGFDKDTTANLLTAQAQAAGFIRTVAPKIAPGRERDAVRLMFEMMADFARTAWEIEDTVGKDAVAEHLRQVVAARAAARGGAS